MRIFLASLFLQTTFLFSFAQLPSHDEIRQRFEGDRPAQWIHTFTGYWQNLHPITILLGYGGNEYHGAMWLESGNLTFDLYGTLKEGKITLQEIDTTERTSGYIIAEIRNGRMTGQWWSTDFDRSATISLQSEEVVMLRGFEPEVLVISDTEGDINLIIQKEEPDFLTGFCSLGKEKVYSKIKGRCEDGSCDKMRFDIPEDDGGGHIICTRRRGTSYRVQFTTDREHMHDVAGVLRHKYPIKIMRFGNYSGNADCLIPVLSVPSFDQWLGAHTELWFASTQAYLDSLQNTTEVPGPEKRWRVQASAWTDLTLLTSETVSGIFTMYNPGRMAYDRWSFMFDLKNGKEVQLKDLGRRGNLENDLVKDASMQKSSATKEAEYHTWVQNERYTHIALATDGFVLFTDFDPMYGDDLVRLPYVDYLEALKRNAFVLNLRHD